MAPTDLGKIYFNPSARSWSCDESIDPAIAKFHNRLSSYAPTPLHSLPAVAKELGIAHVLLKDESHRIGLPAFKILGSSWGIYRTLATRLGFPLTVSIEELAAAAQKESLRLCTATDGNHGRSVARMAKILGIQSKIIVPLDMDQQTRDKISSEGAKVIVADGDYDLAVEHAGKEAQTSDDILVLDTGWPGYEEFPNAMVDGYSTMFLEVDDQVQQAIGKPVSLAVASVGVGSFAQAVVKQYKSPRRRTAVMTVEANAARCLRTSLEEGQIVPISTESTIMCGMNCGTVSYTAWPFLRDGVDACTSVSDVESHQAVQYLDSCGIHLGPCGAAPLAALRTLGPDDLTFLGLAGDSVVVLFGTEGRRHYIHPTSNFGTPYRQPHDAYNDSWTGS